MNEPSNVDATLVKVMNEQITGQQTQPIVQEEVSKEQPKPINDPVPEPESLPIAAEEKPQEEIKEQKSDSPIDEYGNPIEKPKMYSEDEVQRMIRERLSRGRHTEQQPTGSQISKATENFKADPESEESWEVQLENFIDKTIEKKQIKHAEQQWRQAENIRQAEFEEKFNSGMNKYNDFHQVVSGKPITDSMMLATRTLDNPASFIYGACKLHPQELQNIANMGDPYAQAAAIGRLHEKMVKNRGVLSQAPRPLDVPKGELPNKTLDKLSIDQRILEHAKQKRR